MRVGAGHLIAHHVDHEAGRGRVGVADAQGDDVHALGALGRDLLLDLGEEVRGEPPEPFGADRLGGAQSSSSARVRSGGELPAIDLLGRTGHRHLEVVVHGDHQIAACKMHRHGAREAPESHRRHRGRARAGAARQGLPRPPLPDAHGQLGRALGPHELDVGALGEPRVDLDRRPEGPHHVGGRGVLDDRVGVAHRDLGQLDRPAVAAQLLAALAGGEPRAAHLHLDAAAGERSHRHRAGARQDAAVGRQPALGLEVARHHPDAVAAVLGLAPVRVPHGHARHAAVVGHLEDAVAADAEVGVADAPRPLRGEADRPRLAVDHQIVVTEPLPLGESHPGEGTGSPPPPRHRASRRGSADSAGPSPISRGTMSGVLRSQVSCLRASRRVRAASRSGSSAGGQLADRDRGDLPGADHLEGLARDAGGRHGRRQLGHQAVGQLTLHANGDPPVELLPWPREPDQQGGAARLGRPQRPRRGPPPPPAGGDLEGTRQPAGVGGVDPLAAAASRPRSSARAATGSRPTSSSAQARVSGVRVLGEAEAGDRRPHVETGAAAHHRHPAARERVVDRPVGQPREPRGRGALGERQVADAVVRHLRPLPLARAVRRDLEAAVALEGVGDHDLAAQLARRGVGQGALAGRRRPGDHQDLRPGRDPPAREPRPGGRRGSSRSRARW